MWSRISRAWRWGLRRSRSVPERCLACGQVHAPASYADVACRLNVMTEERDELWEKYQRAEAEAWRLQQALNVALSPVNPETPPEPRE